MIRLDGICYGAVKLWVLSTLYLMHHSTKSDWNNFSLTANEEHRLKRVEFSLAMPEATLIFRFSEASPSELR